MAFRLSGLWPCILAILVSHQFSCAAADGQLRPSLFVRVSQSSDASPANSASRALDGSNTTFSLTGDQAGSFWKAELGRPYLLQSIEVVNRLAPNDEELDGLTLSLFNLD